MTEQAARNSAVPAATSRPAVAPSGESTSSEVVSADSKAELSTRESWTSEEILGTRVEVQIIHGGEVYRLRRTRQDKLILYK